MNILPKKRWHVRTRENIARVRRDEAEAANEDRVRQERVKLAEKEARRALLLERSRSYSCNKFDKTEKHQVIKSDPTQHVNFFQDLEKGTAEIKQINIEHEKEKKEEREKYEKQIGYLTYLGQDTNEALGKKSWYDIAPDRSNVKEEINLKSKVREDPLLTMHKYTAQFKRAGSKSEERSVKLKRTGQSKSDKLKDRHLESPKSSSSHDEKLKKLEMLRSKRLKRENEERVKAEMLLSKLNKVDKKVESVTTQPFRTKYNSQFNPELAKQNYT